MPTYQHDGRTYEVDEDGFLQEPDLWNETAARDLAASEGVAQMTEAHWAIVNYLRNYYLQFGAAPMVRKVAKETGYSLARIYELFPSGPAKGACRVAGLPKPGGCV